MALKWTGCLAVLVASAGLAVADTPAPLTLDTPKTETKKSFPRILPPAEADPAPPKSGPAPASVAPVVASRPTSAPYTAPVPCAAALFECAPCKCDERYRIRANADYLLWYFKRDHVPTVFGALAPALVGVNPLPPGSIQPIFGGPVNTLNADGKSGARFGVEGWLDDEERIGLDMSFFQLERDPQHFAAQSNPNGLPVLGPTFNDPVTGRDVILLFSEPNLSASALSLTSETRFWGVEANFRTRVPAVFSDRAEFLVGFRHVQFDENLDIGGTSLALPGVAAPFNGNPNALSFSYFDSFTVHNRFYGPQIGVDAESTWRRFFVNLKAKFAVGEMDETVHIKGATTFLAPVGFTVPGGVLAQRTNSGSFDRSVFTFLPELTINTGVQLGRNARAYVGYNLIYLDQLQRVGETIDGVDGTQIPALHAVPNVNATRPAFQFQDNRFWAQGLNAGVEFRY